MDGVGRGGNLLGRRYGDMRAAAAIGADTDLQPARVAIERAAAEIEQDGEQAVTDGNGRDLIGAQRVSAAGGISQDELQIVVAIGRTGVVGEPPLVSEGGSLAEDARGVEEQCEKGDELFCFHGVMGN